MKIKTEHYEYVKNCMMQNKMHLEQLMKNVKQQGKYKDFDKRIRWDMLYLSVASKWIVENIYDYADDDHIDTMLRKIFKENFN